MRSVWLILLFLSSCFVNASIHVILSNETLEDRSSSFGPSISVNGKIGFLIPPSQDVKGCSMVTKPCPTDWIALVERGGCSFITKVRYMQKSGASAVVVGDPKNPGWITMYAPGETSDIFIPSVFLAKQEYTRILHLLQLMKSTNSNPLMVVLQPDGHHHVIWPLMDVLIILVLSPFVMLSLIYLSWKIRSRRLEQRELAPSSVVSNLSTKLFKQSIEEEPESCAICLEDYATGDELRILPCGHVYHTTCVDGWLLTRKKVCPICKMDVTTTTATTNKKSGSNMMQQQEVTPLLLEAGGV